MNIHITSLDFDGCLYNLTKIKTMDDYVTCNTFLLDFIKKNQIGFDKIITLNASLRQSLSIDAINGVRGRGSCYPAIDYITKHLPGAVLDGFLLSDIYLKNTKPGYTVDTFLRVVKELGLQDKIFGFHEFEQLSQHKDLLALFSVQTEQSEDKVNILYAQIHKIASENPNDKIQFDFCDDKNSILSHLHAFFTKYPSLIPHNVTLRLFKYQEGKNEITNYKDIQGIGMIDGDYPQTVLNMGKIAQKMEPQDPYNTYPYQMSEYITPDNLEAQRQENRALLLHAAKEMGSKTARFFQPAQAEVLGLQGQQPTLKV